ncbi:L-aspartate oxidase [Rubinisphaera margarita]|uniref:L-aspartate oxidase n=1 Tax=Rubinisphaera margarita TaxID=2909586 RepID=UPI001EE94AD1|nr:L-aspartate oxidase [Rubinisphaera margarita]MCG6156192.1 L-aspartate oxidase [Rubinisphaera margarita]
MNTELTLPLSRRYLVHFNPKRIPHAFTDVLVIGGGIAGMRAALSVDRKLETTILTKGRVEVSNSWKAQGGIAGVFDPSDHVSNHARDTIAAGKGLCDVKTVEEITEAAPDVVRELIALGANFDEVGGTLALTQEGGHSHRRIIHALGDATGREIMRAMIERVKTHTDCQIWEETFTIDLLTLNGACVGALVWNPHHGKTFIWAKQTILATGGAGRLYRETTNPEIATGDGHSIAFRAGAVLRDMEMMQFHPTVLYIAGGSRHLISEAVRGEGAHLVDANGYRFMQDYDSAGELAPRDVVSRAITAQMDKTRHSSVYLDLRHLDRSLVADRFPNIAEVCRKFGLDLAVDLIPVRPGAHYMIGGVVIDHEGRTSLPGLWAAGEVTSSGLHGANRLASNSLLEGLYHGRAAGAAASHEAHNIADHFCAMPIRDDGMDKSDEQTDLDLTDVRNSLMSLMWRQAGIRRDREGLTDALKQVEFWDRYVSGQEFDNVDGWSLQNMLLVARLMLTSALEREESRGVHYRTDFPDAIDQHARHINVNIDREYPIRPDNTP